MAKQTINIGTVANDGTGDTLRDGGDKINDNFTELYDFDTAHLAAADPHPGYLTPAEGNAAYAALTHATRHQSGGADAIKLDDLAAPDDNTDLNASISAHGLMMKYPGGTSDFLRADGTFASPGASSTDIKTATITAAYDVQEHTETVTDAAVTSSNQIIVTWGATTEDDENQPSTEDIHFAAVAGTGNFDVTISSLNAFGGPFKLNYLVG